MDFPGFPPRTAQQMGQSMRLSKINARRALIALGTCVVLAAATLGLHAYLVSPTRGLPDDDAFTQQHADSWDALGGTWDVA